MGILQPKVSRKWRYGFVLLQVIDDILDGHRLTDESPLEIVGRFKKQIIEQQYDNDLWGNLIKELMLAYQNDPNCSDARFKILNVIDNMILDYHRRIEKQIWTEKQLVQHHRETFTPSLNLLFMSIGSSSRINSIPEFIDLMGWCSVIRDLQDDMSRGLINIPIDYNSIEKRNDWIVTQVSKAKINWELTHKKLGNLDPQAQKTVRLFLKSSEKYLRIKNFKTFENQI
ncbi:MAG: hypothetical protein ACK5V3_09620 [Bdellovibrionales bacterium]